jgi:hypothetical protein
MSDFRNQIENRTAAEKAELLDVVLEGDGSGRGIIDRRPAHDRLEKTLDELKELPSR